MDLKPFEEELGATPISQLMSQPPESAPPQQPMGGGGGGVGMMDGADPRGPVPPPLDPQGPPPMSMGHDDPSSQLQFTPQQIEQLQQLPPQQPQGMQGGHYNHYDQAPKAEEIPRPYFPEPMDTSKNKKGWFNKMFSKLPGGNNCKPSNKMGEFILVVCIFILLNSKFIYRELAKLPGMGNIDPSLLALVVNSVIAGLIFVIVKSCLL